MWLLEFNILNRKWRHKRIRAKVKGAEERPRFSVFRSNKYLYAQIIDDQASRTLVSGNTKKIKSGRTVLEKAKELGKEMAKKAKDVKIKSVIFDRGGFKYHGKIKAVADGAREEGLSF
ncbi:MAG: 50S ribosomal protein L18 [Parcubacteria group bacterium GW2011_GWA2_38_13b]|nr:MAG: 50S ribosomal protein L18 [Parcubacteria group bacterium GW2011_GWA2_38_13b]